MHSCDNNEADLVGLGCNPVLQDKAIDGHAEWRYMIKMILRNNSGPTFYY